MVRVSKMTKDVECWDGLVARVRPLTWDEREEADAARVSKAIEKAKGFGDVAALLDSEGAQAEVQRQRSERPDLDLGVCVKHGLVSYDGELATPELVVDLDARTVEQIGMAIVNLSTLGDAGPLSGEPPAGSEGERLSRQS